jgi:hypothetical protein
VLERRVGGGGEEGGGRTETLVWAADLVEGDVVEARPGALDDGEPGLEDDVAVGGGDRLRALGAGKTRHQERHRAQ